MAHPVINLYQKFASKPGGQKLFGMVVSKKAPYFGSISPSFTALENGYAEVTIKNRRKVHNHLGTVHAIAMCNMAELAGGTMCEVSMPKGMRWIPKGMQVEYLKKAETKTLRAQARFMEEIKDGERQDMPVEVNILDDNDVAVCRCVITMFLSPNK